MEYSGDFEIVNSSCLSEEYIIISIIHYQWKQWNRLKATDQHWTSSSDSWNCGRGWIRSLKPTVENAYCKLPTSWICLKYTVNTAKVHWICKQMKGLATMYQHTDNCYKPFHSCILPGLLGHNSKALQPCCHSLTHSFTSHHMRTISEYWLQQNG